MMQTQEKHEIARSVGEHTWYQARDGENNIASYYKLTPRAGNRAGKMNQILRSDWLPEWARLLE